MIYQLIYSYSFRVSNKKQEKTVINSCEHCSNANISSFYQLLIKLHAYLHIRMLFSTGRCNPRTPKSSSRERKYRLVEAGWRPLWKDGNLSLSPCRIWLSKYIYHTEFLATIYWNGPYSRIEITIVSLLDITR